MATLQVISADAKASTAEVEAAFNALPPDLQAEAATVPVYLVSPEIMDKVCPPREEPAPECVKNWLEGFMKNAPPSPQSPEELWKTDKQDPLSQCPRVRYHLMGCYLKRGSKKTVSFLEDPVQGPAIFLCPVRIQKAAKKSKVPYALVLKAVYYHELGHFWMDDEGKTDLSEFWARTIEESFCEYTALSLLSPRERYEIVPFMREGAVPYRGYSIVWQPFELSQGMEIALIKQVSQTVFPGQYMPPLIEQLAFSVMLRRTKEKDPQLYSVVSQIFAAPSSRDTTFILRKEGTFRTPLLMASLYLATHPSLPSDPYPMAGRTIWYHWKNGNTIVRESIPELFWRRLARLCLLGMRYPY